MKRHEFEMIAAALREARPQTFPMPLVGSPAAALHLARIGQHTVCARAIADALARGTAPGGNRAFDRELFLRNAGVTES